MKIGGLPVCSLMSGVRLNPKAQDREEQKDAHELRVARSLVDRRLAATERFHSLANTKDMPTDEQAFLDEVNADNWAMLYRCRWSQPDAERVVPQLEQLLDSTAPLVRHESLRALFRIGTPAAAAARRVAELTRSKDLMTKRLAVLALGHIAHTIPEVCVEPLASTLSDSDCCLDALRALAFMGGRAKAAINQVKPLFGDSNAKVRKVAVMAASQIDASDPEVKGLLQKATTDRSVIVRDAANKCLQTANNG